MCRSEGAVPETQNSTADGRGDTFGLLELYAQSVAAVFWGRGSYIRPLKNRPPMGASRTNADIFCPSPLKLEKSFGLTHMTH